MDKIYIHTRIQWAEEGCGMDANRGNWGENRGRYASGGRRERREWIQQVLYTLIYTVRVLLAGCYVYYTYIYFILLDRIEGRSQRRMAGGWGIGAIILFPIRCEWVRVLGGRLKPLQFHIAPFRLSQCGFVYCQSFSLSDHLNGLLFWDGELSTELCMARISHVDGGVLAAGDYIYLESQCGFDGITNKPCVCSR